MRSVRLCFVLTVSKTNREPPPDPVDLKAHPLLVWLNGLAQEERRAALRWVGDEIFAVAPFVMTRHFAGSA